MSQPSISRRNVGLSLALDGIYLSDRWGRSSLR